MSLSVRETEKLYKLISSVRKRIQSERNREPHSAASTRIVESSNPSWSPIPVPVDGSGSTSESISRKRRKRKDKNLRIEDAIRKHIDGLLTQQDLETPNKRKNLIKKLLTLSTGPESSNNQMSRNQRKR